MGPDDAFKRLQQFSSRHGLRLRLTKELGSGTDGYVWATTSQTAVKSCLREENFLREIQCYQRLRDLRISKIDECDIPSLVRYDGSLFAFEMDIVKPPFLLDFGKAYIDIPPDFTDEVLHDLETQQREIWEDRWPDVRSIVWQLEQIGIYYLDTKPGNIMFKEIPYPQD
jgi:hypothetical protein